MPAVSLPRIEVKTTRPARRSGFVDDAGFDSFAERMFTRMTCCVPPLAGIDMKPVSKKSCVH
jgi:hypothetical protein